MSRMRAPGVVLLLSLGACGPSGDAVHIHSESKTVIARPRVPEIVVALDVSNDMAAQLPDVTQALARFISGQPMSAVWGLIEFPSAARPLCADEVVDPVVPIVAVTDKATQLPGQMAQVVAALGGVAARGDRDVVMAVHDAAFVDPERGHYVLLITTGDDTCGNSLATAVKARGMEGVRTIVIGYGAPAASLDAAAKAGGFARLCPSGTDAECGTDNTCAMGVCTHAAYFAQDSAGLTAALSELTATLGSDTICKFTLEVTPASEQRVSVYVNGTPKSPGPDTWSLLSHGQLQFNGQLCDELGISDPDSPVMLTTLVDDRP